MQGLNLTLLQTDLHWENREKNRVMIERALSDVPADTDILVLPEMFLTGFSMEPAKVAETGDSAVINWLISLAKEKGFAICGSLAVEHQGEYRNRFLFVTPEGRLTRYDKRHLFTMGEEDKFYRPGENRVLIHYRGWRILPIVCYDLRFPVWCRNRNEYDLMICVANWPAPRRDPWRTLLQARAVENQCYVVGVNRIGEDGRNLKYSGDSLIVDYKGNIQVDEAPNAPFIGSASLDKTELEAFRTRFPAWADADDFSLSGVKTTVFEL